MKEEKKYQYGLKGIMNIVGCQKTTAWKIKKSGILDDAIIQIGKKIIIDEGKALELLKTHSEI